MSNQKDKLSAQWKGNSFKLTEKLLKQRPDTISRKPDTTATQKIKNVASGEELEPKD
jgi:hypothetical protein